MVLGLGIALASWPAFWGSAAEPRWMLLSVLVPLLAREVPRQSWPFLAWAGASVAWAPSFWDWADAMWKLGLFAMLMGVVFTPSTARGFIIGMVINVGLALWQTLSPGDLPWFQAASPAATFGNKNLLGEALALALPLGAASATWALAPLIIGITLTQTKGVLLGLGLATGHYTWGRWGWKWALLPLGGVAAVIAWALAQWSPGTSNRADILMDTAGALTLWGHGLGAFYTQFPAVAMLTDTFASRPTHAHCDPLELAFDLGLPGVLAAGWLFYCVLRNTANAPIMGFVVVTGLGMSLVSFPFHNPATLAVVALAAGQLLRSGSDVRECGFGGRVVFRPWLARRGEFGVPDEPENATSPGRNCGGGAVPGAGAIAGGTAG